MAEKTRNETAADEELKTLRETAYGRRANFADWAWKRNGEGEEARVEVQEAYRTGIDDRGEGLFYRDNRKGCAHL